MKVVLVSYPLGRTGSSATMGILEKLGYSVSNKSALIGESPMNPKGFFELSTHNDLLKSIYGEQIYPAVSSVPSLDQIIELSSKNTQKYLHFIEEEFSNQSTVAIKSPRGLCLPLFHELKQLYQIKVIQLSRTFDNQVDSIYRVWQLESAKRHYSKEFIGKWLSDWKALNKQIETYCEFETLPIQFEDFIDNKYETARRIATFLELPMLEKNIIDNWIDEKLVNRVSILRKENFLDIMIHYLRQIKKKI